MPDANQLQDLTVAPVITLPADFNEADIKLCKIADPNCEACE